MNRHELAFLIRYPKALKALNFSFSIQGEDQAMMELFGSSMDKGFYVDVGANNPICYSNTLAFYLKGWNGINIDALPGSKKMFDAIRNRDINIEMGVGIEDSNLLYHMYSEPALNTFDGQLVLSREKNGIKCISKKEIEVAPLAKILDRYLPQGQKIDFLDVDVEGMDFQVLQSNNWDKYRPNYVLAEILGKSFNDVYNDNITTFMKGVGYIPCMKLTGTVIYVNEEIL